MALHHSLPLLQQMNELVKVTPASGRFPRIGDRRLQDTSESGKGETVVHG